MIKLGIIGFPLEHSLSPIMHTAALQQLNINGEYLKYEVKEEKLQELLNAFKKNGLKGFNVTIPYKNKIIPYLDEVTETAKLAEAVNTVTIKENGKAIGDNTDIEGFWESLPETIRNKIFSSQATVLGCGGTAKAISIALLKNNVSSLSVFSRNKEKLITFANYLNSKKDKLKAKTKLDFGLTSEINLSNTSLFINTTPVGMYPAVDSSPLKKEELQELPKDAFVYDVIYNPTKTKFLEIAESLNKKTLNGIEMLVRQGANSLKIWLDGVNPPIEIMRMAVVQGLSSSR